MRSKTRISLLILLIIGLHAVPVLSFEGNGQTRWPVLAWAMYAQSFPPGPVEITMRRLVATFASGKEEEITSQLIGLPRPALQRVYVATLAKGDTGPASELIHRLNRNRDDPVVQLRVEGERLILVDTGIVKEALPVTTYRADPSASR